MKALILGSVAAFAATACFGVSDGGFRVKGTLTETRATPLEHCNLKLYQEKGDQPVDSATVNPEFKETFLVAPGSHRFYFVISCDHTTPYATSVFEVEGIEQYRNPIDLGTIELQRRQPNSD